MVNQLSDRERRDRTQYAEDEVKKTEQRLSKARQDLLALQKKHGEFNPLASATAAMSIRTQLEGELAKARAELMGLKSYMNPDAPQVLEAQQRVNGLAAQVAQESKRLVDPKREGGISGSLADFEEANVEKEFAEKAYGSALAALELARSDAARQHRYLATIASPSKPDEATHPKRIRGVITVFVVSFLLMGIGTLMSAAVREHARL
jgi:capsular polysaccharide transport system permease protein